jgi:hypothetical protein
MQTKINEYTIIDDDGVEVINGSAAPLEVLLQLGAFRCGPNGPPRAYSDTWAKLVLENRTTPRRLASCH